MWNYSEEQLKEKVLPNMAIKQSGCFEMKIKRAELWKSTENKAQALVLTFENKEDYKYARKAFFFRDKEGKQVEFIKKHLNQLEYLLGIKREKFDVVKDSEGKYFINGFHEKQIGVFLQYKGIKESISKETGELILHDEYEIKGFYDVETKLTTAEILNNIEGVTAYELWNRNFEVDNKIRERKNSEKENKKINEEMDDFPF